MIASLILVVSIAALLQFFISYCRAILAAYRKVEISAETREVTGIENAHVDGSEFQRLLQLVRLCPEAGDDGLEIRAVRTYYSILNAVRMFFRPVAPAVGSWVEQERASCAYFAAVALDRRIAHSREMMVQIAGRS
jgi:hypothetical protein